MTEFPRKNWSWFYETPGTSGSADRKLRGGQCRTYSHWR